MTQGAGDQEGGKIRVEIDPDLEELIPGYLQNRRNDIEAIQHSLSSNDFETIQRMGHTMKGSGSGYGFDFISAIGMNLEEGAKEQSVDRIRNSMTELSVFLDRLEVVYK